MAATMHEARLAKSGERGERQREYNRRARLSASKSINDAEAVTTSSECEPSLYGNQEIVVLLTDDVVVSNSVSDAI